MATFRDLLNQTKAEIREVDTAQAEELRAAPGAVVPVECARARATVVVTHGPGLRLEAIS